MGGTVTTPDVKDTPEQSASYSLNIDAVIKDGSLQSVPKNRIKYIYDSTGTVGGLDVNIDKISLIRSDTKVDAVYFDDTDKKIHFISDIDKNSTVPTTGTYANSIATVDTKLDIPSDFSSGDGVSVSSGVILNDVAMQSHSKELHVGLGISDGAVPKWVGYTNHKQFGSKISEVIIENAEVKYPSSVPFLIKTVIVSGATYGVQKGGDRIWKINSTTGALLANSDSGTFQSTQSICSDGTNLYVLDRQTTSTYKGIVIKVVPSTLSIKTKLVGLPVTYPGPTGTQYSDIEYTSTGTKIWVAAHLDDRVQLSSSSSGDEYLWNFEIPASNSSTLASGDLDSRMPRTSGGGNSNVGTWVSPSPGPETAVTSGHFSATSNWIQETFPRSLITFPSENGAIYWLCRYSDHSSSPIDGLWVMLWLNRDASSSSNSGTSYTDQAAKVATYTEIRTLCLNRIPYDHTDNGSVALTMIEHPNNAGGPSANYSDLLGVASAPRTAINIDSSGLDADNKLFAAHSSTIQRYTTALDNTFTTLASNGPNAYTLGSKVVTSYNVTPSGQAQRTGTAINIGHNISNDVSLLRADKTAGLDKISKTFAANASQTFLIDHSAVTLAIAAASTNTGTLQSAYEYFYKLSFLFDGYQETNLSTELFDSTQPANQNNKECTLTIADTSQIPRRATDLLLYRAESPTANATKPDSLYRIVKQIPLDTVWTTSTDGTTGVTNATLMHEDTGTKGASYEATSELAEDLTDTLPQYSMSAQINNYHFIGKCKHPKIDDASTYIFRSKVGKFDTFDWLLDFVKIPTVPKALMAFNGRIWAFDEANTYKIEPNNLFIEDIFEGVGCLNDDAIVSTDFGMYFADNKNIYHLTSSIAEPIGESIVRGSDASGTGNHITAWQNRDKTYYTRAVYDPTRRSVYFSFKGTDSNYYAWSWNIPRKRWDLFSFDDSTGTLMPKGVLTLDSGEIFWASDDDTASNKQRLKHFLGKSGTTSAFYRDWTWVSKSLTMGNDTQQKKIKDILSPTRIKIEKTTNGTFPGVGDQLPDNISTGRGTYRLKNINQSLTELRVRLDSVTSIDTCGAIGILFRTKRSPR